MKCKQIDSLMVLCRWIAFGVNGVAIDKRIPVYFFKFYSIFKNFVCKLQKRFIVRE